MTTSSSATWGLGRSARRGNSRDRHSGHDGQDHQGRPVRGMIIQNYDLEVRTAAEGTLVYQGDTYFGFFRAEALAEQIGIRDAALYQPGTDEQARAKAFDYPPNPPVPRRSIADDRPGGSLHPRWRAGGTRVHRRVSGCRPRRLVLQAHFYQDPVCPGSLGLESFRQLLKVVAAEPLGVSLASSFEDAAPDVPHRWTYRGQVLPTAGRRRRPGLDHEGRRPPPPALGRRVPHRRRPNDLPNERLYARPQLLSIGETLMRYSRVYVDAIGYELPRRGDLDRAGIAAERLLRSLAHSRRAARAADGDRRAPVVGRRLSGLRRGTRRGQAGAWRRRT